MEKIVRNFLKRRGYKTLDLKSVLFDMDGVLYDSMKNHCIAWERSISELGIECTLEEFYLYEGQTGRNTIKQLIRRGFERDADDTEAKEIYTIKTKYFTELGPAPVMPGASEVLYLVKDEGLIPVLVTGSGQESLIGKLELNFPGIFVKERMVTAHDVKYGKPNPEPYLMGLKKAGVQPFEAIVIENAPLGVKAASEAGIFTIAVNTGPMDDSVLYEAGADIVLTGMEELYDKLPQIISILKQCR